MTVSTDPNLLLGKRVVVLEGAFKGRRANCAVFEQGLYWLEFDDELCGFRPGELREIGWFRRVVRKLLGRR